MLSSAMDMFENRYRRSHELFARAAEVIPCAIYAHTSPATHMGVGGLPGGRLINSHNWVLDTRYG